MEKLFSEADLKRIKKAVGTAETKTSGEIVPFIIASSERYEVAIWRGAVFAVVLALFIVALLIQFYEGWGFSWLFTSWGVVVFTGAAGLIGATLAAFIPALKRQLVGADLLDRMVHRRAMLAFVEEEVFKTRDRTGILLYISLFEHRVEVVGDEGINAQVSADEWTDVVAHIIKGIKEKRATDALIEAIGLCGDLLEKHGVNIQPDDTNELSDEVRIRRDG